MTRKACRSERGQDLIFTRSNSLATKNKQHQQHLQHRQKQNTTSAKNVNDTNNSPIKSSVIKENKQHEQPPQHASLVRKQLILAARPRISSKSTPIFSKPSVIVRSCNHLLYHDRKIKSNKYILLTQATFRGIAHLAKVVPGTSVKTPDRNITQLAKASIDP